MTSKKIHIEIWSDIMCPYCYIGKKFFEKALEAFPYSHEVKIRYKAFQLAPQLPDKGNGYSVMDYLLKTCHLPKNEVEDMMQRLEKLSQQADIRFNLQNAIAANTYDAHRLVKLAATIGKEADVMHALYQAYYEDAQDYSDSKRLIEIGEKQGLPKQRIEEVLYSDEFGDSVRADQSEAHQYGFDTVPTFLFNKRITVIGSHPVQTYTKALQRAYDKALHPTTDTDKEQFKGMACSIDGICEI